MESTVTYFKETSVGGSLHKREEVTREVEDAMRRVGEMVHTIHGLQDQPVMEETLKRQYQWRIDAFRKMFPWELGPDGSTCGGDRFCVSVMGSSCPLCSLLQDLDDESRVWNAMKAALEEVVALEPILKQLDPELDQLKATIAVREALAQVEALPRYNQPTPEPHA